MTIFSIIYFETAYRHQFFNQCHFSYGCGTPHSVRAMGTEPKFHDHSFRGHFRNWALDGQAELSVNIENMSLKSSSVI